MTLEAIIGHEFKNKRLLLEAMTHPGCAEIYRKLPFNYQRLEFLGDSILGMVIAELLFTLYPAESEGNLARRQAALVRSESLAAVARKLGLAEHIRIAIGNRSAGSKKDNPSNLEDVCEALIGALYLDGGLEVARRFILAHWEVAAKAMGNAPCDAKTALQEWAQGRGMKLPDYAVVQLKGPSHAPEFTIEASLATGEKAQAVSASKRQGEQLAATALLKLLNVWQ